MRELPDKKEGGENILNRLKGWMFLFSGYV